MMPKITTDMSNWSLIYRCGHGYVKHAQGKPRWRRSFPGMLLAEETSAQSMPNHQTRQTISKTASKKRDGTAGGWKVLKAHSSNMAGRKSRTSQLMTTDVVSLSTTYPQPAVLTLVGTSRRERSLSLPWAHGQQWQQSRVLIISQGQSRETELLLS